MPRPRSATSGPNFFQAKAVIVARSSGFQVLRIPAAETRTRRAKLRGKAVTASTAMKPPIELPTSVVPCSPSCSQKSWISCP